MSEDKIITFGELFGRLKREYLENGGVGDDWAAYHRYTGAVTADTLCCIGGLPDDETFDSAAAENGMDTYISGELLNDVTAAYLHSRPDAEVPELITALNYYLDNDCFIEP